MKMNRRITLAVGAALALAAGGAGAAVAVGGNDDGDERATGPGADRARDAAIALYPGGRVTAVETETDDRARWEVEVRRADGETVDVKLGEDYGLIDAETDEPEAQDDEK